jgi:putative ABC transport system substrate-binding protein
MTKIRILLLIALLVLVVPGVTYGQANETYTIGYLLWFSNEAFKTEMTELGYVEGETITYLAPSFEGYETMTMEQAMQRTQEQVQEIVEAGPDIFVTNTDTDALMVRALDADVPIVFARSDDPVATGAVEDLINPGGNTTGLITNRPHERRLQILTEILPTTDKVYYLYSPLTGEGEAVLSQVRKVAEALDVELIAAQVTDPQSGADALANTPEGVDWLFLTPYVLFSVPFDGMNALSLEHRIGVAGVTDMPFPGYLMGYGPNIEDGDAQAARMVDLILRGASPSDLPVQTSENFLMINLEQAEAIDMDIPESILRQARLIVRPGFFEQFTMPGS